MQLLQTSLCKILRPARLLLWCDLLLGPHSSPAALVHRWQLNEASGTNLLDSVGTAHGFVAVIGTGTDYARGAGYVRLAGGTWAQTDFMQLPPGMVSGLTNVTMEIWATPNAVQNWARIFDFGPGTGAGAARDFYLSFCRGASLALQRMEHDPAPLWRVDTGLATTVSNQYHYVATWSKTGGPSGGGLAAWYRNGALIASTDTGATSVSNVNDTVLWLGRSQFTADNTASADYHEVRIYSHAMGSNEVSFSYANGPDTYLAPPAPAAGFTMTTNPNVLVLSWTPGAGSAGSVVVMRAGQATSLQPNYGNNYTGSAVFGNGQNLGSSNYVVFAGAGSSVTVTNLIPGVRYYATVFSYSGSGAATVYNLADAPTANQSAPGVVQSISFQVALQLSLGGTAQATVLATYVGGSVVEVTANAAFVSSATNIITVSSNGLLQAVAYGSAWITASFQGQQSSNTVTVVNPLTNNLKHRYTFTVDASDLVGTAHGTLQGGATVAGNQLVLNGTSAYVSLPTGIVAGYTAMTLEMWVTNTVTATWARIFDFGSSTTVNMFLAPRADSGAGPMRFAITTTGNGAEQRVNSTNALPANVRKHVAITISGSTGILYRDGLAVGTNNTLTLNAASLGSTTLNYLGKSQYADPFFSGTMDEFRIYDTALPASLVLTNFLNGPDGIPIAPPAVANDAMSLNPGAKALIAVLANDPGPAISPGTLELVTPPANGTATLNPNGTILYAHNGSATSSDAFTYRVQNVVGTTSAVASVSLTITNALRLAAPTLKLPDSPPPLGYQIVNAFPGLFFEDALAIHTPPGVTNQIFVVERRGRISYVPDINAAAPVRQVFLDVVNQMSFDDTVEGERGLLGMAFHPGFATNGYFFVFYTAPGSPYFDRLARFTADPVALTVNTNTQQILWDVVDEQFNHNGGDLHFGNDGYLYIGTGDEGNQYNAQLNSQRIDKDLFSALLRIDVDKKPGSLEPRPSANTTTVYTNALGKAYYSIPPSNPFVNATTYLGSAINTNTLRMEIFATGFRHIWRFSIDAPTGDIWVGDVGQDSYEEVNVVTNGGNYGWAYYEALTPAISLYPSQTTLLSNPPPSFVNNPPVWFYPHTGLAGDAQYKGNSISGGVVYHGSKIPALTNAYIVADFVSANVWALWRTNNTVITNRIAGQVGVAGFGLDPGNGDVLLANYVFNQIQRLVRVDASGSTFPAKLSDTGAFADVATLAPNPGLVNYEPIVSFWSDYAIKRRWFAVPDLTNTVTHAVNTNWTLPTGMIWVKHFDLELTRGNPATKKRIETRFLVKNTNGIYGVSYAWNAAGDEAFLVPDGGTNFSLTIVDNATTITQQWTIPSRTECLACHVPVAGHALSFNTRELNQTATMNGVTGNQLASLSAAGYFANPVTAPQTLPAFAAATNTAVSLEARVRSYLAVNCLQCHQPAGAGPSTWDARPWLTLAETSLLYGTPYNNGANPANKLVIPGDPAHSVLLQRIRGNGFGRMPPLATAVIDQGATNLLHQWITSDLTNRLTFAQWQVFYFGSTNALNAAANADPDNDKANNYYEYLTYTSPVVSNAAWGISITQSGTNANVLFPRLANRGFVVEASDTLWGTWSPWNVPNNTLWFSAANVTDTITGPLNRATNQFFRVIIYEP